MNALEWLVWVRGGMHLMERPFCANELHSISILISKLFWVIWFRSATINHIVAGSRCTGAPINGTIPYFFSFYYSTSNRNTPTIVNCELDSGTNMGSNNTTYYQRFMRVCVYIWFDWFRAPHLSMAVSCCFFSLFSLNWKRSDSSVLFSAIFYDMARACSGSA